VYAAYAEGQSGSGEGYRPMICKRCSAKFVKWDTGNICRACYEVMVGKFLKQTKRK
jgi:hypothetical protein